MEEKDYKKLYEDVLERAKNGLKDKNYYLSQTAKEVTEYLFPQLKETEDEKVRKNLTRFLINFNNGCYSRPSENEIDSWIKWIDKKCEQKSNDKAEPKPKFKAGDWVRANRSGNIFKILSVNDKLYRVLCYDGVETNYPIEDVDYDLDYWTIKDAKDGDVLVDCFGNICIYQKPSTNTYYHTHCYGNHKYFIDDGGSHEVAGTYPATKEQRYLLFQKMVEAGYKWDAEKKELNKIEKQSEQKSQCKSALEVWKDMRIEVYMQASGNRHEPNCSDDSTKMFSLDNIDEIFEKVAEKQGEQKVINEYNEHEPTSYEIEKWNEAYEKGYDIGYMNGKNEQKPKEWSFPYNVNETVDKLIAIAECLEMDGDCLFNGYSGTECGKFLRDLARKQVECKPVDNVEPKFKVGDIISDGISEAEIVSIDENKYNVTDCEIENYGYICNWVIYFKDQDKFKLVK